MHFFPEGEYKTICTDIKQILLHSACSSATSSALIAVAQQGFPRQLEIAFLHKTVCGVLRGSVISPISQADKTSLGTAKKEVMCLTHCSLGTCLYLLPFVFRESR